MSKKLLLIATGGTIASRPAEDGLTPEMTSEEHPRGALALRDRHGAAL